MPKVDPEDLMGVGDIAALAEVSSAAVSNWRRRHPDFPEPIAEPSGGSLWLRKDVMAFLAKRDEAVRDRLEHRAQRAQEIADTARARAQELRKRARRA